MNDLIEKLVSGSGNNFHCRVANFFRDKGWTTVLSSYYVDAATDKSREIDLIVEKCFTVINEHSRPKAIRLRLYIECKYISFHTVFWFDDRDDKRAYEWIYANTPFTKQRTLLSEYHHIRDVSSVAKLFASENKRNEENDPIFRALNQCLQGYVHNKGGAPLTPVKKNEELILLEYPAIVCSTFGTFYRTDVRGNQTPEPIADNFLLEVNYAFLNKNKASQREYFLLDVVSFECLDAFLERLDHEVEAIKLVVSD